VPGVGVMRVCIYECVCMYIRSSNVCLYVYIHMNVCLYVCMNVCLYV
jgi:hypothetical protein